MRGKIGEYSKANTMSENIWVAAADNKIDLVKSLIESGKYTPNAADPNGFTPIHAAASYANIDLLRYLLNNGGNPNVQDSDGDTPLHHTESLDAAKVLVQEFNANYRLKNNDGLNVKEYFIEENEFPDLIKFFTILEQTGDPSAKELSTPAGSAGSTEQLRLPDGQEIRAFLSGDNDADDDSEDMKERRQRLQAIFENTDLSEEQREEQLRNYVVGVVSENMGKLRNTTDDGDATEADPSLKRRK